MLLSFGLDAHEFLFTLVLGKHGYGDGPELEPVVQLRPALELSLFFDNRSLRKHYTELVLGRLSVIARVPERSSIRSNDNVLVEAAEQFGIRIVRCHLSEDPPNEYADGDVDWPRLLPFDRASDFSFISRVPCSRNPSGTLTPWRPGQVLTDEGPLLRVPGHWITGILNIREDPLGHHPSAVRDWTM